MQITDITPVLLTRSKADRRSRGTYVRLSDNAISDIEIISIAFGDLKISQADAITMGLTLLADLLAGVNSGRLSADQVAHILSVPQS